MKYSLTLLSLSMASAMATPFASSTQKCNIAPSASSNRKVQPYHTGKADTAIDCQTFCASDDFCKSFAFGLVKGHSHPSCLLFKVSASEVPARKDGLHVFDKQCAADRVPTSAPTTSEPWGSVPKKVLVRRSLKCNCAASGSASGDVEPFKTTTAATAKDCQALAEADSSCQSFLYGLPSGSSTPVCKLYKVVAAKVPARGDTLFVFDKSCSSKQATKVQKSAPKVTKVAEVKVEKQDNDAYKVSNPKPKTTKVQKPKAKATKVVKVEDDNTQYAQVGDDSVKHQAKVTKVENKQPKATKAAKVDNEKVQKNQDKSGKTEAKVTKVENKQPKATKVQNSKPQATKADSPKTLATKVRNNEHQATKVQAVEHQATQAEGKKSACKTSKGSAAQPKITQA
ncbi:PAN/Apple domain [Fusarium oxysporum f. sp. vasinfectum]|nr:PAN/Apple domain [Fusarium oxysporum f. sp. vasinfectum]